MLASPCDGALSAQGTVRAGHLFQAKGIDYSAAALLTGDAAPYDGGAFATIYLAPGITIKSTCLSRARSRRCAMCLRDLFSVNPATAATRPGLFARNERVVLEFENPAGRFALVLVGALIVGAMRTRWTGRVTEGSAPHWRQKGETEMARGEALGAFELGSTVIVLLSAELHSALGKPWQLRGPGAPLRLGEALLES